MKETTSLLPKKAARNYSQAGVQSAGSMAKNVTVVSIVLLVACVALSGGWPRRSAVSREIETKEDQVARSFSLTLDQKMELYDNWKRFLSWRDVANKAHHKWDTVTKDKNLTDDWNAEKIKNHTQLWANQTEEQGKEWWENTNEWFQNISEQVYLRTDELDPIEENEQKISGPALETDKLYIHTKHKKKHHHHGYHHRARSLVFMNQSDAFTLLFDHDDKGAFHYSSDYFLLNQGLDAQVNQAYCAVAASMALLNSLRGIVDLPEDPIYHPYPYATQSNAFNGCTDANVIQHNDTFKGILSSPFGLNLDSARGLLECHLDTSEWQVEEHHVDADTHTLESVRDTMKEALANPMARVMINYDRAAAGQIGGGHFSPVGAYSPSLDAFLVMDVAKYKYPPVWIPVEILYSSLSTIDNCGTWDGPAAQLQLPNELLHPHTADDLAKAMAALNCEAAPRGFLVVLKK